MGEINPCKMSIERWLNTTKGTRGKILRVKVSSDLECVVDSAESKQNIMVEVNVIELNKTEDNLFTT